jgi:hypothetical protein
MFDPPYRTGRGHVAMSRPAKARCLTPLPELFEFAETLRAVHEALGQIAKLMLRAPRAESAVTALVREPPQSNASTR